MTLDNEATVVFSEENDFSSYLTDIERREPLLHKFLATILKLINDKANWSLIQDACDSISFQEWDYDQYKEPFRFDSRSMKPDMTAFRLYKECGDIDHMPVWVHGNGNCLFNSASMILVGNELLALDLRVSTTIAMVKNCADIQHSARSKGLDLVNGFDYITELKNSATVTVFQSTFNVIAMCYALKASIFLLYPNSGVGLNNINALVNHGLMGGGSFKHKGYYIMWSGSKTDAYGWNHFVPLLIADRR